MDNPVLIKHESKNAVKPGEIDVKDDAGDTMFRWKFDGGGERKLTIEHLRRDLCEVHGTWLLERLAGR
jgi:type II restriction enzyme